MASWSQTAQARSSQRSEKVWTPHAYQEKATRFLVENGAAALFADPGTGKTSTVLNAFCELKTIGVADKMLVVAPRRVCQLVWSQEAAGWAQFKHLRFAWLHDSRAPWDMEGRRRDKNKELETDADVYLINPEGVAWLYKKLYNHKTKRATLPFDTVCVDELTKFKTHTAGRSKMLRALTENTKRLWGLTGSPTPNGYEDLFGQILLLDGGAALGRYYSHFRDKYFEQADYAGFTFKLREGAAARIEEAIRPLVLRISAADWLTLPKLIDNQIFVTLDDKARALYDDLKKEMLIALPDGVVTAENAAALYSKLAQLANGALYLEQRPGQPREVVHVHDAKLDALEELVEQLAGAPLLVAYEFNHDLDRLKAWWEARTKTPLRYLGRGVTDKEVSAIERDWNANAIPLLAVQPASSGHGLNFQKGGAQHVCWFSATWDFELYDQLIQRILRQGNSAAHVVNHLLLVENSIDELKYAALAEKDTTQERFLQALNTAFTPEQKTPAAGSAALAQETSSMAFEKLRKKAEVEVEPAPAAPPKGWGARTAADEKTQRATINEKLRAQPEEEEEAPAPVNARAAFSKDLQAKLAGEDAAEEEPVAAKKPRATKAAAEPASEADSAPSRKFEMTISADVLVAFNDSGDPVPTVTVTGSMYGLQDGSEDMDAQFAARLANIAETLVNKLVDAGGK